MLLIFIIAVSLSMDAFSLSLAYGTLNLEKNKFKQLALIVGIFHFIMPILGTLIGKVIINTLPILPNTLVFIILFLIGVQMILESFKEERNIKKLDLIEMLLFGFAVSIDSFTTGISLIYQSLILSSLLIALTSFTFTYLGLILGKKINKLIGKISTIIGGIILIIIGIMYVI